MNLFPQRRKDAKEKAKGLDERAFLCVFAPLRETQPEETTWQIERR
jgi:hypothetical protein